MVSINPSHHTDDIDVLNSSTERVIEFFLEREKRRKRDFPDDETQGEAIVSVKPVYSGLMPVLDYFAYSFKVSRSIITRCLSHYISAWLDSVEPLRGMVDSYQDAQLKALEHGTVDLSERIRSSTYRPIIPCSGSTTFRTIGWLQSKVYDVSVPSGVPVQYLFCVGLMYALSATENARCRGIVSYFQKEMYHFVVHAGHRAIDIRSAVEMVDYQISQDAARDILLYNYPSPP